MYIHTHTHIYVCICKEVTKLQKNNKRKLWSHRSLHRKDISGLWNQMGSPWASVNNNYLM